MFSQAGCQTLLCTRNLVNKVQGLVDDGICLHVVPKLAEILDSACIEPFPYSYDFDEVKDRVFLVLHTSGSTGL